METFTTIKMQNVFIWKPTDPHLVWLCIWSCPAANGLIFGKEVFAVMACSDEWQVAGRRKGAARRGKQPSNPKLDSHQVPDCIPDKQKIINAMWGFICCYNTLHECLCQIQAVTLESVQIVCELSEMFFTFTGVNWEEKTSGWNGKVMLNYSHKNYKC